MVLSQCYNITSVLVWVLLIAASSQSQSCGKRVVSNLANDDTAETEGPWPWHAMVFEDNKYRCDGSILNRNTVLTVIHCVVANIFKNPPVVRDRIIVHVGTTGISVASQHTQKYTLDELIIYPKVTKFRRAHNIALIKLSTNITYTDYVQPVCLLNGGEDQLSIVGSFATVIKFGRKNYEAAMHAERIRVEDCRTCSKELETLNSDLFYLDNVSCIENYIGINPCLLYKGGGLFISYNNVWYIRGIVGWSSSKLTVFIDISKYLSWILQYLQKKITTSTSLAHPAEPNEAEILKISLNKSINQSITPQPLSCGKRDSDGIGEMAGYWKWHAALFKKRRRSFEYECGGTILNQNTILTAALCVMTSTGPIAPQRLSVQVGRSQLYVDSNHAQDHSVNELIIHPGYNATSFAHNIALIKLATNISFNDYIQPICLWNRDDDVHSIFGYRATVIGFNNDEDDETGAILQEARIYVVDSIMCKQSDLSAYCIEQLSKMFCAGNRQGNNNCNDETGGGLFFNYDDVWYIRGVMSFPKPRPYVCNPKEYTLVTDVAKYLSWIVKYLPPKSDIPLPLQYSKPAPKLCKLRC